MPAMATPSMAHVHGRLGSSGDTTQVYRILRHLNFRIPFASRVALAG
jgi:hypothetical protein